MVFQLSFNLQTVRFCWPLFSVSISVSSVCCAILHCPLASTYITYHIYIHIYMKRLSFTSQLILFWFLVFWFSLALFSLSLFLSSLYTYFEFSSISLSHSSFIVYQSVSLACVLDFIVLAQHKASFLFVHTILLLMLLSFSHFSIVFLILWLLAVGIICMYVYIFVR